MMTGKKLGEQAAYPEAYSNFNMGVPVTAFTPGMTKREAFTMAAMQGCLANSADGGYSTSALPKFAVDLADRALNALATIEAQAGGPVVDALRMSLTVLAAESERRGSEDSYADEERCEPAIKAVGEALKKLGAL